MSSAQSRCDKAPEEKPMKRMLISLLIGGTVFGCTYGLATRAGLGQQGRLGSTSAAISACQTGGLRVSFASVPGTSAEQASWGTAVIVSNIDESSCGGSTIQVRLNGQGASGIPLAEATSILPHTGSSERFAFASVSPSEVTGVGLTIAG